MGNELYHHGILGMKWGIRRYQNEDGSLTRLGKKRFNETYNNRRIRKATKRQAIKSLSREIKNTSKHTESEILDYQTKLDAIKSGTLKAGRDFITTNEHYTIPFLYVKTSVKVGKIKIQKKREVVFK